MDVVAPTVYKIVINSIKKQRSLLGFYFTHKTLGQDFAFPNIPARPTDLKNLAFN